MMIEWSLENELCNLLEVDTLGAAVRNLKVINTQDEPFIIRTDNKWLRGGAETFLFRFWIESSTGRQKGFILKACTAFQLVEGGVQAILQKWVHRRQLLSSYGISTPHLFAIGNGIILEELIPYSLKEVLQTTANPSREGLLHNLFHLVGVLSGLGFHPIELLPDLMSRGTDVVLVDFGEDLGSPHFVAPGGIDLLNRTLSDLRELGINWSSNDELSLRLTWYSSLNLVQNEFDDSVH